MKKTESIAERGNRRWAINLVRSGRTSDIAALDILADLEAWYRKALPLYRDSWPIKTKAHNIREWLRAVYVMTEDFFMECESQNIEITKSAKVFKSDIERIIES